MADKNTVKVEGFGEVSSEKIKQALEALEKTKEQRRKAAERARLNPELKAKADERAKRLRVKNVLLCRKAVAAGITVSDKEIDEYILTSATAE